MSRREGAKRREGKTWGQYGPADLLDAAAKTTLPVPEPVTEGEFAPVKTKGVEEYKDKSVTIRTKDTK